MKKKVLIIDDDIDLVEAMRMTLEDAGLEVIDAQSGDKGEERARKEHPDLILLDIMMGEQDEGFHVAYRLRNQSETSDIPIIMLSAVGQETGFSFDPQKDEAFLPVEEFIDKPVNPDHLVEKVKSHLGY
ncbi:MAG TPA: response regulator [Caldithrix abyssi]|uniref:Response regulator n=1 Tax=Caldithrix abyssi TaxID=187145 RepID=A0A7V1PUE2_CALAY|nr:response regulator [Caldithrix abyssi]